MSQDLRKELDGINTLLIQVVSRISSLEHVILKKGLVTERELSESLVGVLQKVEEAIAAAGDSDSGRTE